ncbi:5850_t:CDS:2, partial [Acaulospora colombiana]
MIANLPLINYGLSELRASDEVYFNNDNTENLACTMIYKSGYRWEKLNLAATMSERQSSSRKRSASAAGMERPEKESKKTKTKTALEKKLVKLQQVVSELSGRSDAWGDFAPDGFVNKLAGLRDRINGLTPEAVREFISGEGLKTSLFLLKVQETNLNEPLPPMDPQRLELTQEGRELMASYVKSIRAHLTAKNGVSSNGEDEFTSKYLSIANKLCQAMPSAFDSEAHRRKVFEEIFSSLDEKLRPRQEFSLEAKPSTVLESAGQVDMAKTIGCKGGELA